MKQIKLFTHSDADRLEENTNEWLTEKGNCNIMDIKYDVSITHKNGTYAAPITRYSVMIIYMKD